MNQILPALYVIGGGLLVGILNFINDRNRRKFDERQKLRELLFKSAIEVWKKTAEIKEGNVQRSGPLGGSEIIESPETYILRMAKILETLEQHK